MEKYRYLLKNVGLMTISSFGSKILSFLLVPLYTSVLTTAEYGTYDFCVATMFLIEPLLCSNIAEAVVRFSLDKDSDQSAVFTVGLKIDFRACLLFSLVVFLNWKFGLIRAFAPYSGFLVLYFTSMLFSDLMTQLARGSERMLDCAVAGILASATVLVLNLLLLLVFHAGLRGYFIANACAMLLSAAYLAVRLRVWKNIHFKVSVKSLQQKMLQYSRPLVLNSIGSWINNVSDRYVVTWLCGVAANGVYSVAYKIPAFLNVFQTIFNQAWILSAVNEFDSGHTEFYTRIYNLYNAGIVLLCSLLLLLDKGIAKVLFANAFYAAWKYAPFLLISVVFSSLSGLIGGVFIAAKKPKILAKTTAVGTAVNTVLNIVLVWRWGPAGAAAATFVSYVLIWAACFYCVNKLVKIEIDFLRDMLSYGILVAQAVLLLAGMPTAFLYLCEAACFAGVMLLYSKDTAVYFRLILGKIKGDKQS
ncbi:MAG: oligosaccharide flippase family protein [Oscillospiraceae bacterium]|nr:oligosaccharide flippase family protein [Oscillospiraceae bacterium]MDD3260380.1 oligosaccharide flippase family protein [Oscillospiraceae bacterium]